MKKPLEILFGLIRIPIDYLLTLAAFLIAYNIRLNSDLIPGIQLPVTASIFPEFHEYISSSSISALVLIGFLFISGLYSLKRPAPLNRQISRIFFTTLIWLFAIITFYFLIRTFPFSRLVLIDTWILTFLLVSFGHVVTQLIQNSLYRRGFGQTRVLLIGASESTRELAENFFRNPQYHAVGYIETENKNLHGLNYLGPINDLQDLVEANQIDKIIQCKDLQSEMQEISLRDFCRENQLEYSFIPSQLEVQSTNIDIETPAGIPVITLKPTPLDGWGRVAKRTLDFFGSLFLLIVLSPFLLIIAILIKLDDPKGNIIFKYLDDKSRVKRVGQRGQLFNFMKFRTMVPNSHNLRYSELAHLDTRQGTPMVKIKNDPRVTKIGRFLRKTSLDELPQLLNVLIGDMALVGPRPHLPEEVARYDKHHKFVLTIKPGITGMAQVSGRSDLDFEREVKLDTYYIENWSLLLDLKILIKTILVVFKRYEE